MASPRPGRVLVPLVALLALATALAAPAIGYPERTGHDREFIAYGNGDFLLVDVTGDGWTDLLAVDDAQGGVWLYEGTPVGLTPEPVALATAGAALGLLAGDLSGDGHPDLIVVTSEGITSFAWTPSGVSSANIALEVSGGGMAAIGDLNGDGRDDLAILGSTGVRVWFGRIGDPMFAYSADLILSDRLAFDSVSIGDATGDGRDDLVVAKKFEIQVYVQEDLGLSLQPPVLVKGTSGETRAGIIDVDGGLPLLIAAVEAAPGFEGMLGLWRWEGQRFQLESSFNGNYSARFAIADLDDDRRADIALLERDGSVAVFHQRVASFTPTPPDLLLTGAVVGTDARVGAGDVNGDGFVDVVVRTHLPDKFLIYLQEDAAPVLVQAIPSTWTVNRGAYAVAAIDLRDYFADDHNRLTFSVVFLSEPDHLNVAIDGSLLSFDALGTWTGIVRLRVSASDGNPDHAAVESNEFSVLVNDVPAITSVPWRRAVVGETYSYVVSVADGYPALDRHEFRLLRAPAGMAIDGSTGLVTWTPATDQVGTHGVAIQVTDAYGGVALQEYELVVAGAPGGSPLVLMAVGFAATTAALLAAAALINENAKWAFLLFLIPLYSKIKRERVLDHFVRGQIYGYIQANPGEHYNGIKDALGLTNGSLAHHLRTLEREQFIKSKRYGLYRRFYPMHMRLPSEDAFTPNEIQTTILRTIREHPGITQKEIAERLGLSPPTVNYHIGLLSDRTMIRVTRAGRSTHCTVIEEGST